MDTIRAINPTTKYPKIEKKGSFSGKIGSISEMGNYTGIWKQRQYPG